MRATSSLGAEPHTLQQLLSISRQELIVLVSNSPPQHARARPAVLLTATQLFSDQLFGISSSTPSLDNDFYLNDSTLSLTACPVPKKDLQSDSP